MDHGIKCENINHNSSTRKHKMRFSAMIKTSPMGEETEKLFFIKIKM